ncbi:MAG: hypothetical protein ACE37F_21275 [Nannocystaceae bacterium]|nr:hypothetical protein [bacterium]
MIPRAYTKFLILSAALSVGCGENLLDESACDAEGEVQVVANLPSGGTKGVSTKVEVTGTILNGPGVAVRSIELVLTAADKSTTVFPVSKDSDNFKTWSAELPLEALVDAADVEGDDETALTKLVSVSAQYDDACDSERSPVELGRIRVDREALLTVEMLQISQPEFDTSTTALPVGGADFVDVEVTADANAIGATVRLESDELDVEPDALRFSRSASGGASAKFKIASRDEAGTGLLTASSKDETATRLVRVVGAPTVSPSSWALEPGERVQLSVRSDVGIRCSAIATDGLEITANGTTLIFNEVSNPTDSVGRLDILVRAEDDADADSSATINCSDVFGQRGSSTILVSVPEPMGRG